MFVTPPSKMFASPNYFYYPTPTVCLPLHTQKVSYHPTPTSFCHFNSTKVLYHPTPNFFTTPPLQIFMPLYIHKLLPPYPKFFFVIHPKKFCQPIKSQFFLFLLTHPQKIFATPTPQNVPPLHPHRLFAIPSPKIFVPPTPKILPLRPSTFLPLTPQIVLPLHSKNVLPPYPLFFLLPDCKNIICHPTLKFSQFSVQSYFTLKLIKNMRNS